MPATDTELEDALREFLALAPAERARRQIADPAYAMRISECWRRAAAGSLPAELQDLALRPLRERIEQSRCLLTLADNTADGGAEPVSEAAWRRASDFLLRSAEWLLRNHGQQLDLPDLTSGSHGSVDLHWDQPDYEVLINVPVDGMASFYGDDRGRISIKGRFDPTRYNEGLLLWLTKAA